MIFTQVYKKDLDKGIDYHSFFYCVSFKTKEERAPIKFIIFDDIGENKSKFPLVFQDIFHVL